jgi:hypothetical protein
VQLQPAELPFIAPQLWIHFPGESTTLFSFFGSPSLKKSAPVGNSTSVRRAP